MICPKGLEQIIQEAKESAKKRYQKPTLRVFGSVETLTFNAGTSGMTIDSGKGLNKTS